MNGISDHLQPGLDIVFIGFNPGIRSGETGHHYAGHSNRFWKILYESGLTPRRYLAEEDTQLLDLGYGLTNIVERTTRGADEITKEEYSEGREQLRKKLERYRPQIACYVGKGVYIEFSRKKNISWGVQEESVVEGVLDFVAPSSSGLVRMSMKDITAIYRELAQLIKKGN